MTAPICDVGDYSVTLEKNGVVLAQGGALLQRVEYSRVIDAVSSAQVDFITAGEGCCGQLGAVDHWNTDLIISAANRDTGVGEVVWRGPVRKATYRKGSVTINANDVLSWSQVRVLEYDMQFNSDDVSDIFVGLWNNAVASVDAPVYELVVYRSGTVESRTITGSNLRMTWNVVQEMLDAGLDVTTYGSRIIVGIPAFTALKLSDRDVQGTVEVVKDGDEYVGRAIANAAKDAVGIYPPGPRQGSNGYPLVEGVVVDTQLSDQASAQAAAQASAQFAQNGVRRVRASGGLVLLPSAGIDARRLIAGQLVTFTASETCYAATETLRLGRVTVVAEAGRETATIELQPVGQVQAGAIL